VPRGDRRTIPARLGWWVAAAFPRPGAHRDRAFWREHIAPPPSAASLYLWTRSPARPFFGGSAKAWHELLTVRQLRPAAADTGTPMSCRSQLGASHRGLASRMDEGALMAAAPASKGMLLFILRVGRPGRLTPPKKRDGTEGRRTVLSSWVSTCSVRWPWASITSIARAPKLRGRATRINLGRMRPHHPPDGQWVQQTISA